MEQFQEAWRTPIQFYGQVVDENTNPVAGAQVDFDCNDLSTNGTSYYHTGSDANGLFSIVGITGKLLSVHVSKEGYYSSRRDREYFDYAGNGGNNFISDAGNRVVFHLLKKKQGEHLIEKDFPPGIGQIWQLHHDGTPIELDLLNGSQNVTGSGQLKLEFWRDLSNPNAKRFDWKLQISAVGGGLVPADEEFAFTAPDTGYQPSIVIDMPATNQVWLASFAAGITFNCPTATMAALIFIFWQEMELSQLNHGSIRPARGIWKMIRGNEDSRPALIGAEHRVLPLHALRFLGGVVLFLSMGYGLSDAYHAPAWWFVALDKMLQLLEAPVVMVLRLLYHPTARFDPPGFFTIDLVDSSNFFVVVGLCALWSVGFGYLARVCRSPT